MEIDNVFQDIGESGPQQIKYGVLLCLVKEGLTLTLTLNAQDKSAKFLPFKYKFLSAF